MHPCQGQLRSHSKLARVKQTKLLDLRCLTRSLKWAARSVPPNIPSKLLQPSFLLTSSNTKATQAQGPREPLVVWLYSDESLGPNTETREEAVAWVLAVKSTMEEFFLGQRTADAPTVLLYPAKSCSNLDKSVPQGQRLRGVKTRRLRQRNSEERVVWTAARACLGVGCHLKLVLSEGGELVLQSFSGCNNVAGRSLRTANGLANEVQCLTASIKTQNQTGHFCRFTGILLDSSSPYVRRAF